MLQQRIAWPPSARPASVATGGGNKFPGVSRRGTRDNPRLRVSRVRVPSAHLEVGCRVDKARLAHDPRPDDTSSKRAGSRRQSPRWSAVSLNSRSAGANSTTSSRSDSPRANRSVTGPPRVQSACDIPCSYIPSSGTSTDAPEDPPRTDQGRGGRDKSTVGGASYRNSVSGLLCPR